VFDDFVRIDGTYSHIGDWLGFPYIHKNVSAPRNIGSQPSIRENPAARIQNVRARQKPPTRNHS
jgi:hypothetical protein